MWHQRRGKDIIITAQGQSLGMLQRLLPQFFSLASIYFLQVMDGGHRVVVSIDSLSLRGAGIRRGLGLGCGPVEVVVEVVLIDSSLLRPVGTGRGLALGRCLVDGPGLDTDL